MSHDIRTPINGVIGSVELMNLEGVPDNVRAHLETIKACGESLIHIISNVLDLSKIEAGQIELQEEPFDLIALAEGLSRLLRPEHEQKIYIVLK